MRQGARSFTLFFDVPAPLAVMRTRGAGAGVNTIWVIGACLAAGAVVGLAWAPLVPLFGRRSVEALGSAAAGPASSPRPVFLAGVCAALFTAAALRLDARPELAPGLLLCAVLVGVTAVDLRYRIIPNRVVLPAAAIGYAISVALAPGRWLELLIGALAAGLIMLVAAMASPAGLGHGRRQARADARRVPRKRRLGRDHGRTARRRASVDRAARRPRSRRSPA